ncbi:SRSO17 transposase [Pseudonocardia autotrophica]|uniref:Transposase IS701-like DDE domain-containing protein n=1 Tax=Pseudonocardia autotrophica TaxID=2074 RepID=A0A1Y2MJ35_PSEAH|nr:hypothetical protein BG845_06392 [Pseudonocardia autotrophica]TDN73214.1 SRSO17 transposase [Pseudonocardia autotrophica]
MASLDAVVELISGRFRRAEPRQRVGTYLRGLLAGLERKNGWTLAEHAGAVSPDGMQRLLRTAGWDVEGVRDDLRGYVLEHLGYAASGVFIIDETGFIKKGVRSAGVQRQYTGTSGKIDNCQLGVFLAYASDRGRALIDRELYLPVSWTEDRERCRRGRCPRRGRVRDEAAAGDGDAGPRPRSRGTHADVVGERGRGLRAEPGFRDWLSEREIPFVLATRNDDMLTSPDGNRRPAKVLATIAGARDPDTGNDGWERRAIGPGAHGMRVYDWTAVALDTDGLPAGWGHWLLVRRQTEPAEGKTVRELAFYRCAAPATTPLRELVRVAGARWAIEECFQTSKNEAGLDQYQVRSWRAWHAHITLAMLAAAYLAVTRATEHTREPEKGDPQLAIAG